MTKTIRHHLSAAGNKLDRQSRLSGGEGKAITTGWDISRSDVIWWCGVGSFTGSQRPLVLAVAEPATLFEP